MSEEQNAHEAVQGGQEEGQQRKFQLRDTSKETQYANFFTVTGTTDAVLLAFGVQFGRPDAAQLESKVALSWHNTKRLAVTLGAVIRRFEQQNGEIDIGIPGRGPAPSGNAGGS
jgi:hypothetical protein